MIVLASLGPPPLGMWGSVAAEGEGTGDKTAKEHSSGDPVVGVSDNFGNLFNLLRETECFPEAS